MSKKNRRGDLLQSFDAEIARDMRSMDIENLNSSPIETLRFSDFAGLKSGRDEFSPLSLEQLRERVTAIDVEKVSESFPDLKSQANCLRWILRGLDTDKAIRKVKTDAEVSANSAYSRRPK
ncbi:MAG: hypothetical protein K2Y37_16520 [Pirellulales bacterium]|nr:hypothetical protein [Pirellulales bacterium]